MRTRAQFVFTRFSNSFSVHVTNLESLEIEQIKKIEHFVSSRNGIFDFQTYVFSIQKKIEYPEFIKLLQFTQIDADTTEYIKPEKKLKRIGFGQYKGMLYAELPDAYILWLKVNYKGSDTKTIAKELTKRNL